jgi:hypothetical protein
MLRDMLIGIAIVAMLSVIAVSAAVVATDMMARRSIAAAFYSQEVE